MELFKYLTIRLFLLAFILILANPLYKITFYKDDIDKHGDILENLWAIDQKSEAIYFGESSNFHITENDTTDQRISYTLNDLLPDIKVATVDNSGLHAGTYLALIKNIPIDMPIKFLVITLNYRSFGADWRYAKGENYLSKTERMLEPGPALWNKFRVSLKNYDYRDDRERDKQRHTAWDTEKFCIPGFEFDNVNSWDSAMAWQYFLPNNTNLTKENIPIACHYIKNFAFDINLQTNERIKDFDKIMAIAKERNYTVFLNLLDENMIEAQKLVGKNLLYLMEKNRKLLIEHYERKGAIVVDNFYTIPDSCFVDRNWPTEHYDKKGKTIIASNLANKITQYYNSLN